jgi:hypothetical protein
LVDSPVYGSIWSKLIGITLYHPDEYADFQSKLAVYHDDFGDYSTDEPTMDGTASLSFYFLFMKRKDKNYNLKTTFKHWVGLYEWILPKRRYICALRHMNLMKELLLS